MPIIFRDEIVKSDNLHRFVAENAALWRLRRFLNAEEPKLMQILYRLWDDQQNAITYKELREYIMNGDIDINLIDEWRQDYSKFVVEHMTPLYREAIETATEEIRQKHPTFRSGTRDYIEKYTDMYSAQFVTNCTSQQIMGIRQVVRRAASIQDISVDGLARTIRPMIGLDWRQTSANMNYFEKMRNSGLSVKKAREKSIIYGAKQHRYRAMRIARTEMAFAYNDGAYNGVKEAVEEGLMGKTIKKWCTADDERVCRVCNALDGVEKELDEPFDFFTKLPAYNRLNPPAHPHCRCVVLFIEKEPPKYGPEHNVSGAAKEIMENS